jgi:hypothetical protein
MRLGHQARNAFNQSSALAEVKTLLGLQYGFQNLLFGWLDTANQNMPTPLSSDFLMVGFALLEPLLRPDNDGVASTILSMWKQVREPVPLG